MAEEDNQSLYNENNKNNHVIQLLPTFHGLDLENPYLYLREFEEVCNTYNDSIVA